MIIRQKSHPFGWLFCFSPYCLILLRVIGLDGFGLDDDGGIASGEGAAFSGDGACDIARGESQCHGDSSSDGDD